MAGVVYDIDAWQSILLCFLFAILYVGSLYVWSETNSKSRYCKSVIASKFIIKDGFLLTNKQDTRFQNKFTDLYTIYLDRHVCASKIARRLKRGV
jgi:hypothetical protein